MPYNHLSTHNQGLELSLVGWNPPRASPIPSKASGWEPFEYNNHPDSVSFYRTCGISQDFTHFYSFMRSVGKSHSDQLCGLYLIWRIIQHAQPPSLPTTESEGDYNMSELDCGIKKSVRLKTIISTSKNLNCSKFLLKYKVYRN